MIFICILKTIRRNKFMNFNLKKIFVVFLFTLMLFSSAIITTEAAQNEVNLYTNRHYDTDKELLETFEEKTGIKVNVLKGDSDKLIERIAREGENTPADLLITADAGRLYRAKNRGILQPVNDQELLSNIPANLRDSDNNWFGLTVRARIIAYAKDRVDPSQIKTYKDLTDSRWENKILVRSSANIYNQSLLASLIELHGEDYAQEWAKGVVENMARRPKGNDRAQATAVAAEIGDLAIMNTYYMGKMLNSSNKVEVNVANNIGIIFPSPTHVNVSGIGLTKYAKNKKNAIRLMRYLSNEKAQKYFAEANYEYPANPEVKASKLLRSWGDFTAQDIDLTRLGELNQKAVRIFNKVGWQ